MRRVDPLTFLSGALALAVFAVRGFDGVLTRDLAFYAYAGQMVAAGVPPYEGVFNQAGPLSHALPALGVCLARLFGLDELLGMRLFFWLVAGACVSAAYVVGRDVFRSRAAGITAAATLTSFAGFIELAGNGPRDKTPMVLLLILALWAAQRTWWFTAGGLVALATLVLQPAFFVGAPAVVTAALVGARGRTRIASLVRFVAGGFAVLAVTALAFVGVGAIGAFLDGFLLVNLRYTTTADAFDVLDIWQRVPRGFGLSTVLLVAGLVGTWVIAAAAWLRPRLDTHYLGMVTGLALGGLGGIVWTVLDFDNWPDAFVLLPIAALGVGGLVADRVVIPGRRRVGAALAGVVTSVALVLALRYATSGRDHLLDAQRANVERVTEVVGDGASILSIEAPQALVLTGRRNPSRHQLFSAGLDRYVDDTWPGGKRGYLRWVRDRQPTLIAVGSHGMHYWLEALSSDYRRVGCAPRWIWLASRTLDDTTVAELTVAAVPCRGPRS